MPITSTNRRSSEFLVWCDFYTIDVADQIGQPSEPSAIAAFVDKHPELVGRIEIEGVARELSLTRESLQAIAAKYLAAIQQAAVIYRLIENSKGKGNFIPEVSMDETDSPQTPIELLVILAAAADEGIP